jgi:hypothetical protein
VDTRGFGQLGRAQRPPVGQRPVEAELVSQVNREQIESRDSVHEQLLHECIAPCSRISRRCHLRDLLASAVAKATTL